MKLIKGILGCALAAGLTTFAADKAQAGVVLNSDALYSTLQVKLVVTYQDPSTGKFKKASLTNKQILADLESNTKSLSLVVATEGDFDGNFGDIWIYNSKSKSLVWDLTDDSVFTINPNELISNDTEKKNSETETSAGTTSVAFYDNPQFDFEGNLITTNGDYFNPADDEDEFLTGSQEDSDNWFELTGIYNAKETFSDAKNGEHITASAQSMSLSGNGQFTPPNSEKTDITPVTGSGSAKGSGTLVAP